MPKYDADDAALTELVATNIRRRRAELGLSQERLGLRCGLHRTYIGAVERGEKHVTLVTLHRIAQALDKPMAYFIEDR